MPQDDANSSPTMPGRDGRNALLLLAVVVVALVAGYRGGAPAEAPVVPAHEAVVYSAPVSPPTPGYDLNKAMALAGNEVPSGTESYYFFAFVDETPAEQEAADLADKLQQASKEHDFLGVAGPDADRNRRALLGAHGARHVVEHRVELHVLVGGQLVVERGVLFCDTQAVRVMDLAPEIRGMQAMANVSLPEADLHAALAGDGGLKEHVKVAMSRLEKELVSRALQQTNGNVTHAARLLKISRKGLQLKMKELGLREGASEKVD